MTVEAKIRMKSAAGFLLLVVPMIFAIFFSSVSLANDEGFSLDDAEPAEESIDLSLAEQYYDRAVQLHLAGYLHQAVEFYKNAIFVDPEMAAYHADLGEAYRVMGSIPEAISEIKTAILLDPTMVNAYTTLGVVYEQENLPHLAIQYHRKAIEIDPEHYISYNNLGHAYDALNLISAAMENYRTAIELDPEFAPAYDNLGTNLMRLKRLDEGVAMIIRAIEIAGPNHPQIGLYHNDLGAAYVMVKNYEDANEQFRKALNYLPDNMDIQRNYQFIQEYLNAEGN